ncbi:hypothetical protein [Polymorphum gilvum]|uniref:Uncharacterized protein n=1 Tax=Polymorphum gilvum (strain LMG 25793 / CGMCC 1.9160 / SL003B-26A1) TaxID=991905 RepID=F2IW57_POLGS|nr:hypothetical protein [Polymorphum gilvum]ADZ71442.1 hypothetical protein SL003B_3019 [Polymorphum gilvum SL003B-26A1]
MRIGLVQPTGQQLAARRAFPPAAGPLTLWLRASNAASLVAAEGGLVPPPPGGAVAQWRDGSGLGHHASALVDAPLPVRSADGAGLMFAAGSGLAVANTPDINIGTPTALTHLVRFVPGSATDTRVVYEEGGSGTGLSVLTSGGRIWSLMWSAAPAGSPPNFVDLVDQGPATASRPTSVAMAWSQAEATRRLFLDGVLTHSRAVGSRWPSHSGNIRIALAGDSFYGSPAVVPAPAAGASFDGVLLEIVRWQA